MAKKSEKRLAKQEAKAVKRTQKAEHRQHRRQAQAVLARDEIAEQLHALASQVASGSVVLGDTELELPPQADFEISYKLKKKGGHQIEVEIEWGKSKGVPLLAIE